MYRPSVHNAERNHASQLALDQEPARHPPGFGLATAASLRSMQCLDGSPAPWAGDEIDSEA